MDPRDEREIEQALASLASDKQPETMPADVATRFDAHLKSLIADDATVIRSNRFGKTFGERITKNTSWLAAAMSQPIPPIQQHQSHQLPFRQLLNQRFQQHQHLKMVARSTAMAKMLAVISPNLFALQIQGRITEVLLAQSLKRSSH